MIQLDFRGLRLLVFVRNPTLTPPKNLRLLATPQTCFTMWKGGRELSSKAENDLFLHIDAF